MLKTMVHRYKRSNQIKLEDKYPAVELEDMSRLRLYFDRSDPEILQQEIAFNFLYYFSLRGRETLPHMGKNSVIIEHDSTGRRYMRMQCDMLSKNAKASLVRNEFENLKNSRIYENGEDTSHCPVAAFELYREKIENCGTDSLFPKPCKNQTKISQGEWYTKEKSVGKNTLDTLMATLSRKANLSKRYTNHCLRVTAITILKENGASNEEIATFSGHKNPCSVQRYCRKRKDESFQKYSDQLNGGFDKSCVKVGKFEHGEIRVNKEVISVNKENGIGCAISVNFSGNFENCVFNINQ